MTAAAARALGAIPLLLPASCVAACGVDAVPLDSPYDPLHADGDADGDGVSNGEEVRLGTDPRVADPPALRAPVAATPFVGLRLVRTVLPDVGQ